MSPEGTTELRRTVSRWQIVGLAMNDVVGSGVYLLPAAAAAVLGPVSVWAVVAAGLAVLLVVLCFAEASSYFREPGGAYLYTKAAFGPAAGFAVGWMSWLTRIASLASLSVGFAQALTYLWPAAASGLGRASAITVPLVGLTALNVIGIRSGVRTAMVLVVSKLVPLVVFVVAGAMVYSAETAAVQPAPRAGEFGSAALLLLFAFAGFENSPAVAGEYREPRRDLPIALLTQLGLVTGLYVAVQWVALGTLPDLAMSETPLADAAELFLSGWGGWLLSIGAVVAILGTNNNSVLAGPRYLLALARDGFGWSRLAEVHPRFRTPANAIVLQSAIALPLALSGTFLGLAALSVVARLATYAGTAASVPVLRKRRAAPAGSFRVPGGPLIPIAAVAVTLGLAASATAENLVAAAIALAVGFFLRALSRR